ncbi:MAG: LysR family transcriptional regulator [Lachnospiraceae bacterium]|nr:LysR family transcriptional regulator [Lachnospiraceae bacterium]
MTLLSYEIFNSIIEQGSFAKAAEIMHLTPSAVSHSVSSMEEEIGTAVFVRDKNGVKLTATGEQLYPYIRRILQANKGLNQTLEDMRELDSGFVKVGCTNTVCLAWMPDIITTFNKVHPNIQLQVFQGSYSDVNEWAKRGTIDVGIISKKACEGLEFEELYEDELVCVTPKGYFNKKIDYITPKELKNQPFVVQQDSYNKDVNSYLYEHQLEVRSNCHILDEQSTIAMVQCGAGLSIMPMLFIGANTRGDFMSVDIYPLKPKECRNLGLCYPDKSLLSAAAAALSDHIREYVKTWEQK